VLYLVEGTGARMSYGRGAWRQRHAGLPQIEVEKNHQPAADGAGDPGGGMPRALASSPGFQHDWLDLVAPS